MTAQVFVGTLDRRRHRKPQPESCPFTVQYVSIVFVTVVASLVQAGGPVRVDIGMSTGRSDTATIDWHEWQVADRQAAILELRGLRFSLRPAGESAELAGKWHKAGLATGATMATDGVTLVSEDGKATLILEITGLESGRHSITTYHNLLSRVEPTPLTVAIDGDDARVSVSPSVRVAANESAAFAHLQFDAHPNRPTLVRIEAPASHNLMLNGIVVDGSDPARRASRPQPADRDLHVDCDSKVVNFTWKQADTAEKHYLFVASHRDAKRAEDLVRAATVDGDAHVGTTSCPRWSHSLDPSKTLLHYFWRVDSADKNGRVTRGNVWRFRPRKLAFPGAEGYGRFAIGGRGGSILKVVNLNDSGPGSLRAAVEAAGPRIVVFDVSGRIQLKSKLVIRNPFLTIAGQSAPAKGICISNYNLGMLGTHDNIVRFLRVRPGDVEGVTLDGMGMASTDHSIIDHCSISWTQDEAFSSRGAKNITLQRTLISEALNVAGHKKYKKGTAHGYAASIGGDVGSFHHNLLAHCAGRNWSLAGGVDAAGIHAGRLDIRNNIVYNWRHRTTDGGAKAVNFVNNYYRPGPATRVFHVLKPEHELPFGPQEYFVAGNVMEGKYGADHRYAGVAQSKNKPMSEYVVDEPFFESFVTTTSAEHAAADVLADVGCNRPVLDEHDARIVDEVRKGSAAYVGSVTGYPGLPDSQDDVGGWEEYPEVRRSPDWDSDGDGLPNWWERKRGLDPNSPSRELADAHADADADGYTNIEEYLHLMAQPHRQSPP